LITFLKNKLLEKEVAASKMLKKKHVTFKILLFLVFTDILETFIQFCFKKSTASANLLEINNFNDSIIFLKTVIPSPFLWIGLFSVFCLFTIWSTILSKIDLSVAVPVASFSYIGVPIVSMIFLHEAISLTRWAGICFILLGVIFVSVSTRHKEKL
jgi:drug/metabolite transporter (DMT)-like permease